MENEKYRKNVLIISRDFPPIMDGISIIAYETFKGLSKYFNTKVITTGLEKSTKNNKSI